MLTPKSIPFEEATGHFITEQHVFVFQYANDLASNVPPWEITNGERAAMSVDRETLIEIYAVCCFNAAPYPISTVKTGTYRKTKRFFGTEVIAEAEWQSKIISICPDGAVSVKDIVLHAFAYILQFGLNAEIFHAIKRYSQTATYHESRMGTIVRTAFRQHDSKPYSHIGIDVSADRLPDLGRSTHN